MTLGSVLKKYRSKKNVPIAIVQNEININNLCRYENNVVQPSFKTVVKLARYYKIDLKELERTV